MESLVNDVIEHGFLRDLRTTRSSCLVTEPCYYVTYIGVFVAFNVGISFLFSRWAANNEKRRVLEGEQPYITSKCNEVLLVLCVGTFLGGVVLLPVHLTMLYCGRAHGRRSGEQEKLQRAQYGQMQQQQQMSLANAGGMGPGGPGAVVTQPYSTAPQQVFISPQQQETQGVNAMYYNAPYQPVVFVSNSTPAAMMVPNATPATATAIVINEQPQEEKKGLY